MIHKNLTPFYWAPRITSRQPPQPEMAVCVRAAFRMEPGKPLEAIEDPIEQGFMSGDTFALDDINQEGPLEHHSDFAEWKLHGEMLLKGSCHPPGGSATSCEVRYSVGNWTKSLQVTGPRVYEKGLLLGGKTSAALPFQSMPLTWENAFGGPKYAPNPAGRGHTGEALPTVEQPGKPIKKTGGAHTPATMMAISPNWPQRAGKRGKNYGPKWKKTRAPFYADDFDWTYFQAAPEDQWIDGYLRGDEDVVFENLHPTESTWRTKLPGLRIRAFVKGGDGVILEPKMNLDTVHADTDDGKLFLTWRGHVPVKETDLTDVQVVLIASENLADEELPFAHYEGLLQEFEEDPVGLNDAFPPGFLAVATAIEAAQIAERDGEPLPDLQKVADEMPPDCPFPPWFLAVAAGADDPLGLKDQMPANMFDKEDPLGIKATLGGMADPAKVDAVMSELPKLADDPSKAAEFLGAVQDLIPPGVKGSIDGNASAMADAIQGSQQAPSGDAFAKLADAKASGAIESSLPAAEGHAAGMEQAKQGLETTSANLEGMENASDAATAGVQQAQDGMASAPDFDSAVGKALEPLDNIELPTPPPIPDTEAELATAKADLAEKEQKARAKHGDQAILGLFAMGNRLIDKMPRPGDLVPDLSPIAAGLGGLAAKLSAQGASDKALGPLTRLQARVEDLVAELPQPTPVPEGEFVRGDLRNSDFSGQTLENANFQQADLTDARFVDADLTRACFDRADLTGADLTGAKLDGADFRGATLTKAILHKVTGSNVNFIDAALDEAEVSNAELPDSLFEQARLDKADLSDGNFADADMRFASLSETKLTGADLHGANFSMASVDLARCDDANLSEIVFDMGSFTKCRLQGANLQGARSSMGSLSASNLTGANLAGCSFEKVDFMKAVLDGASLDDADIRQAILRDTRSIGASFQRASLHGAAATGEADFSKCNFAGADGKRSTWMNVNLSATNFADASFVHAYFQDCHAEDAVFARARLKGACFRKAKLIRPVFADADLSSADFTQSELNDATFRGANCYDVKLLGATAIRSDFTDAFVVGVQLDDPNQQPSS